MKYLYSTINVCSALVPFIFSFHPKIGFNKHFRAAFISIALVALPFIAWDIYFTSIGVWGFTPLYVSGLKVANLPIEEVMFFGFIPFSCLFTYYTLKKNLIKDARLRYESFWGITATILLLCGAIAFSKLDYTSTTFMLLAVTLLAFTFFYRGYFAAFFTSYLVLLVPLFITNGVLTGYGIDKEVVWYNNNENLGLRILTIPVEDFLYGMLLILLNVMVFEKVSQKSPLEHAA